MPVLKLQAKGSSLKITQPFNLVSTQQNYDSCEFSFDSSWDGYAKTAIFYSDTTSKKSITLVDDKCVIPWENLINDGILFIGVFGVKDTIVLATNFVEQPLIPGSYGGADPTQPTQDIYAQLINDMNAFRDAEALRVTAETSRQTAETTRINQETTRQSAETTRQSAETTRQSAETTRQSAETTRQSAETTRQSQETAREQNNANVSAAELIRISNENERIIKDSTRPNYVYLTQTEYDALTQTEKDDTSVIYEITDDDGEFPTALQNLINEVSAAKSNYDASVSSQSNLEVVDARGSFENIGARFTDNELQLASKANKDEILNGLTAKDGVKTWLELQAMTTGNAVGDYYYCSDGDGVNPAGNYRWTSNGWSFGGTGDDGYNKLNEKLTNELIHTQIPSTENEVVLSLNSGVVYYISGSTYASEYFGYADYPVNVGDTIKVTGYSQASEDCPMVLYYNIDNNVVSSYWGSFGGHSNVELIVPEGATKIRVQGATELYDTNIGYKPRLIFLIPKTVKTYIDEKVSPLNGKFVVCNGDSIMRGSGNSNVGFMEIIAERNGMTIQNYAVAGGIIATTTNTSVHSICSTIDTMDANADYVIIEGGFNDYTYKEPLGTITNGANDVLAYTGNIIGGMEQTCRNLLAKFPTKKIGFVFSHKINATDYTPIEDWNNNGTTRSMRQVHDAIVSVLKKYSIPYCDLYNISQLNTELESFLQYTANADGTHPTQSGYELFYCDKVEAWMKML